MDSTQTQLLLGQIAEGDSHALETLLEHQRDFLRRLLALRMEPALRRRVDPSDVIQETLVVANGKMDDYLRRRPTAFRLWLRRKALERLVEHRRKHFAQKRSVERELSLQDASSALAHSLADGRPSKILMRRELCRQIQQVVADLSELDREILLLRHVEGLTNSEIADLLKLDVKTASKRYGRALLKLSNRLSEKGITL